MTLRVSMPIRPRRRRKSEALRSLVRETHLRPEHLVLPLFIVEGVGKKETISSMPGTFRLSVDYAVQAAKEAWASGIKAVALFPKISDSLKDPYARESINKKGLLPRAIRELKESCPDLLVIGDVAMDPYSSDGHDGVVKDGRVLNDETLEILGSMALVQAEAGIDLIAPSDMMDGRVGHLRRVLDEKSFQDVGILSYAAKYASSFYGPFRDALDSAPRAGDKKTYQMDPANAREAIQEVLLDIQEGADIVMVKPAGAYLDIIHELRSHVTVPIAAYQVSGEYAMVKAAAAHGWVDEKKAMMESLIAIRRSGGDMIFTYFALAAAKELRSHL